MTQTLAQLKDYIKAGAAKISADLVIENGTLVNVMTTEFYQADIAIYKEKIVAVGNVEAYIGDKTKHIDATGKYITPGLIDGHIHVECSKMSMTSFANAVVPFGTTSVVSGLDETVAVAGLEGVQEVFKEIEGLPLNLFWGAPYKTPYTIPQSTIAFNIDADVQETIQKWTECYGVWETVREAIETQDEDTLKTLVHAQNNHLPIFGCAPMATGVKLNEYLASGIRLDHESYGHEELVEKARNGMNVLIRESSVTHFLAENIRAVTEVNPAIARHVSFCTDDVTATDILEKGHLDNLVKLAIQAGVEPITAIQMATINSAEAYRIDDQVGSVSPGRLADILIVDQPGSFNVELVISRGQVVAENKEILKPLVAPVRSDLFKGKLKHELTSANDFEYKVTEKAGMATVQTINSQGAFVRKRKDVDLIINDGVVQPSPEKDVALVSVLERFGKNGNQSLGFTSGWGLKKGAMASSSAPDDNNIVVMGVSANDMSIATNKLIEAGGGQIVVIDGEVISFLALPVGGIMSDLSPREIEAGEIALRKGTDLMGSELPDPMFYMSFLPITAIPDLAITDLGMVDCVALKIVDPIIQIMPLKG
ncbi:adenine deaminase C-terminal domain-containing protein [Dellaglioa algida]|uniref:Adenine deaminase n=1 Tax=Dellaglioa algida TaxID=105612 RepID=A0A5C6MGE5_9LACO|nr:adenine deaminase C-terminal domain-containing protein [Dellaglioa algida]MDK1716071.1 amidohydrolase family protein [Dellaglioa algida]MDK1719352.1 amidohydrolase family protein [Dellaglioa algida]MDK1721146.1 amidohydrolase family protein [Dellaglioa algida]MDK1722695.1 amidohydrolase family protein [Dellaglioa algida]MDK1724314.1 amidohydrolase family protein [Dellaglioa algida]